LYQSAGRMFQSSPVPEDGCNQAASHGLHLEPGVSILTRPGGRVQLRAPAKPVKVRLAVSILTRPGGRVQPHPGRLSTPRS